MARARGSKQFFNFVRGWNTEASPMTFPENTAKDLDNVVLDADGSIRRRAGVDFEAAVQGFGLSLTSQEKQTQALTSFLWENVAGIESGYFIVTQQNTKLHFHRASGEASSTFPVGTIDFSSFVITAERADEEPVRVTAGLGYLFVVGKYIDPFYVIYDADAQSLSTQAITLQVRDFSGLDDGLDIDEHPTTLSNVHHYNLLNQGWPNEKVLAEGDTLRNIITYYFTTIGTFPSNADIWYLGRKASTGTGFEEFFPKTLDTVEFGNTLAPRGHFILNLFRKDRSTASGIAGLSVESLNERVDSVTFHNGRLFYAGLSTQGMTGNVYFSQQLLDVARVGRCYQEQDPTADISNDLLATDGGVIPIPNAGKILRLEEGPNGVVVFAANGVWEIKGSQGAFSATDFAVERVTDIGCVGDRTVINADGVYMYWSDSGIIMLQRDEISGQLNAVNISKETIQSGYLLIGGAQRRRARGAFIKSQKKVVWLYNTESSFDDITDRWKMNGVLILDMNLQAFYKYSISDLTTDTPYVTDIIDTPPFSSSLSDEVVTDVGVTVTDSGDDVFVKTEVFGSTQRSFWKMLVVFTLDSGTSYDLSFAGFVSNTFTDWADISLNSGADYTSFLETGYELAGNPMVTKQPTYVFSYVSKTSKTQTPGGFYELPERETSILSDTWTELASLPVATYHHASAAVGTDIYVIGGLTGAGAINTIRKYDTLTDAWSVVSTTPPFADIHEHSAVAYQGDIYVLGGIVGGSPTSAFYKWDITLNTWTSLTADPAGAMSDHGAVVQNGKLYVAGGNGGVGPGNSRKLRAYDFSSGTWDSSLADMANLIEEATLHAIGSDVWLHGGQDTGVRFPQSREYDVSLDTWTTKSSRPIAVFSHAAAEIGSNIYIFGGFFGATWEDDVHKYSTASDTYTAVTPDILPRANHTATKVGSALYVIGGNTSGAAITDKVARYIP